MTLINKQINIATIYIRAIILITLNGLLYEERPAGVVKNSRCSLRRMRCAYCEDCARRKTKNELRS